MNAVIVPVITGHGHVAGKEPIAVVMEESLVGVGVGDELEGEEPRTQGEVV